MNCPNCEKTMEEKCIPHLSFYYEESENFDIVYKCKECKIEYNETEDHWKIPKKYEEPTEAQIKAIDFINSRLRKNYEPLLKNQCWRIINENLKKANRFIQKNEDELQEEMEDEQN